jgi:hypothetical protein
VRRVYIFKAFKPKPAASLAQQQATTNMIDFNGTMHCVAALASLTHFHDEAVNFTSRVRSFIGVDLGRSLALIVRIHRCTQHWSQ